MRTKTTLDISARKRLRTKTVSCMPGLNIQWPFSQLILLGVETEESRRYALGHHNIAHANLEYWIVETKGKTNKTTRRTNGAIVGDFHIPPRPNAAHIVGTVTFSKDTKRHKDQNSFHQARDKHCIAEGSDKDWDGTGDCFGWQVSKVRALTTPMPIASTGQTGFGRMRYYPVTFA